MTTIKKAISEYLALRRGLGFKLHDPGVWLSQFACFLEERCAKHITVKLALEWITQPVNVHPAYLASRLGVVRGFAQYRSATDPRTEVPSLRLLPHRFHRKTPYIYTDSEIGRLITAAQELPSKRGLRAQTFATVLGLLVVTGIRIGEAVALDCDDVDLSAAVLTIRGAKFRKSRLVPVHASTRRVLQRYAQQRERIYPKPRSTSFFIGERGNSLRVSSVQAAFAKLSRAVGLRGPSDRRGPRLHDFRHGFAINTLLRWYRTGADVEHHLPKLSTYLGHTNVRDTYWYLSSVPELMRLVVARLERPRGWAPS